MLTIASVIGGLLGIVSAAVPRAFDHADKRLTFAQELKIRQMEAELRKSEQEFQLKAGSLAAQAKIEESYYEAVAAEAQASREHLAEALSQLTKPTGYAAIDLVNACIRPFVTVTLTLLFLVAIVSWMFGVGAVNDEFGKALGASFLACLEAIFFFVFGARQVMKPPQITR